MKACKGINKAKNYSGCGINPPFQAGLCYECYKYWLYNTEDGLKVLEKQTIKAKKVVAFSQKKEATKIKKETRFELLSYPKRVQEARRVFQKWIRERDKDLPCVSCGNPFAEDYHAGHFKKAEVYSQLIFNEDNVHKQCVKCNVFLGGNEANYRVELVKRIGENAVKELEQATPNKVYRYSNEELKNIINTYKI